jgi:hypothetical protein
MYPKRQAFLSKPGYGVKTLQKSEKWRKIEKCPDDNSYVTTNDLF